MSTGSDNREHCAAVAGSNPERRHGAERRRHVLRALLHGSLKPRRHGPRRRGDRPVCAVDWHHPQWLAIGLLIVLFSGSDALLTLMLVEHGAYEANPLMAPLINGSGLTFVLVKIGLTATGVVLLTQLARIRAFGRIPVGALLYTMLLVYGVLIVYECGLLEAL